MNVKDMFCRKCGRFVGLLFGGEPAECHCRPFLFKDEPQLTIHAHSLEEAVEKFGERRQPK